MDYNSLSVRYVPLELLQFYNMQFYFQGQATSAEDKEFTKLEKRQQISGELEVNGQSR